MKKEIAHAKNINGTYHITYSDGSKELVRPNGEVITFPNSKFQIPKKGE